jgi:phosphoserine phosphatase RsbU/P
VKLGSRSIGLGLFIVRQIATAHGGSITVSSNEAHGTSFVLRLPPKARA